MNNQEKKIQKLEQELLKARHDIKRLSKVKSDFVSVISHELRTPLSSIKESVSLILDGIAGPLNENQRGFLTITKNNIDRLTNIITDILDFSRLQSGGVTIHRRKVDINEVIKDVYLKVRHAAEKKGLSFNLELSDELEATWLDPERISQVLKNLISNGIKFNREKGSVTIYSGGENSNGRSLIKVTVEDTGVGIPKNKLKGLFKKFNPLDASMTRSHAGIGLGLAICKDIISLHKGEIWAESMKDAGSKFIFTLPVYKRDDEFDFLLDCTLEWAMRNDLKLSLVVLRVQDSEDRDGSLLVDLEKAVQSTIRGPEDKVVRFDKGDFIALMAGTDRQGVDSILKRLKEKISVPLNFGISVYPDTANTKEELVKKAKEEMMAKRDIV